jgi:hypothetical protein
MEIPSYKLYKTQVGKLEFKKTFFVGMVWIDAKMVHGWTMGNQIHKMQYGPNLGRFHHFPLYILLYD